MSVKDTINNFVDLTVSTVSNPSGTASLVSGFSTIDRALKANVTPEQLKVIFPDLQTYSDEKIIGFAEIGADLIDGSVTIPKSAFNKKQKEEMTYQTAN